MADLARELARLNGSAKGYRSAFVLIRNRLAQSLPLWRDGPTLSQRRTINDAPTSTQTRVIIITTKNSRTSLAKSTTISALWQTTYLNTWRGNMYSSKSSSSRWHRGTLLQQLSQQCRRQTVKQDRRKSTTSEAKDAWQGVHDLRAEDMVQPDDLLLGRTADGHQSRTSPMGKLLRLHAHVSRDVLRAEDAMRHPDLHRPQRR
jgi:hypothetical protein